MVTVERKEICRPIDTKRKLAFLKAITVRQLWVNNFVLLQLKLRRRTRKFVQWLQFVWAFFMLITPIVSHFYSNFLLIN